MIQTKEMNSTVTAQASYDLIKGIFEAEDASEILSHMLLKKINFHEASNFSKEIRFGEKDTKTIQRIKELKQVNQQLDELVKEAKASGKSMKITSTIQIELV